MEKESLQQELEKRPIRPECKEVIQRVHERLDGLYIYQQKREEADKSFSKFVDTVHHLIYGDAEKPGLVTIIHIQDTKLNYNRTLLFILLGSLIGLAFFVIRHIFVAHPTLIQ